MSGGGVCGDRLTVVSQVGGVGPISMSALRYPGCGLLLSGASARFWRTLTERVVWRNWQ